MEDCMPGERPLVVIIVDNPFRDLPGMVLVALDLCQHGIDAALVPMNLQRSEVERLRPRFVLANYFRRNNARVIADYLDRGIAVGVLDTEGGVIESWPVYANLMPEDKTLAPRIAVWCSWGPRLAGMARDAGVFRADQIAVTGAPRMDFYAPSLRAAAIAASPVQDMDPRPLVLINTNVPLANPRFQTASGEVDMFVRTFGYREEYVREWLDRQTAAMHGLAEVSHRLAGDFPEVRFVLRPHPFEATETYHRLIPGRANLTVTKQGTVDGWLLRSCALVQRSCSTAIEARLIGLPALSPSFVPAPCNAPLVESLSTPAANYDALRGMVAEAVTTAGAPRQDTPAADPLIHDWFYLIDGQAHQRVGAAIRGHLGRPQRADLARAASIWILQRARELLKPSRQARETWRKSEKSFDVESVRKITAGVLAQSNLTPGLGESLEVSGIGADSAAVVLRSRCAPAS
jgi:surface carbohydrate biosynthesis protein